VTIWTRIFAALLLPVSFAAAGGAAWMNKSLPAERRASLLLAAMTPAEKLGMLHGKSPCAYVGCVAGNARLGIPELHLQDGPVGVGDGATGVTQLAAPVAAAASWDVALLRAYGEALGAEQWGKGTNVVLAPTINIVRDPRWGRAFESFGEDPFLAGRLSAAGIAGIQSQGPLAQVKHYAVYNQEEKRNTPADNAIVSERAFREIYLPAFEASTAALSAMCSYSAINGAFACENGRLQKQVLHQELGFKGFITSDWGATHSTVASLQGGLDLEMPGSDYYGKAGAAVPQKNLDEHALRILTAMFRGGLFDHPQTGTLAAPVAGHATFARRVAIEGSVLLKNDGALPLPASSSSIAVIGAAGKTAMFQGGGSAGVIAGNPISPHQGIAARAGTGITVTYAAGIDTGAIVGPDGKCIDVAGADRSNGTKIQLWECNSTDAQRWVRGADGSLQSLGKCMDASAANLQLFDCNGGEAQRWTLENGAIANSGNCLDGKLARGACPGAQWQISSGGALHDEAVAAARKAETAIVFVGKFETEGADLAGIDLSPAQDRLIRDVAAANPNTIVVVNSGSAVTMPWLGQVRAVFECWYPGQEYGNAIAALLFGDANPSGKLPVTFPKSLADVPAHTAAQWPGENGTVQYSEGIDVGYRWYDRHRLEPLFPFGYGLSYTTFAYAHLKVERRGVSFELTNTGQREGAEVAQVYVAQPATAGEPPKSLRGFAKVTLKPGETRRVTISLDRRSFQFWDAGWRKAPGGQKLLVGSSSRDIHLTSGR
jgi:beta-glucosidase